MPRERMSSVELRGHRAGESPDDIKRRATGFVARFISRGGRLVIGFACRKSGQVILTIAVLCGGQYFNSPSLDALAGGLGVLTAVRFLLAWSRHRSPHGSIAIEPEEIRQWEKLDDPALHSGAWSGDEHDWP